MWLILVRVGDEDEDASCVWVQLLPVFLLLAKVSSLKGCHKPCFDEK